MICLEPPRRVEGWTVAAVARKSVVRFPGGLLVSRAPVAILIADDAGLSVWDLDGQTMSPGALDRLAPGVREEFESLRRGQPGPASER